MSELLGDWRKGEARSEPWRPAEAEPVGPGSDRDMVAGDGASVESFGACMLCAAPRSLRSEPLAIGTSRLTLVCDECGTRTDI